MISIFRELDPEFIIPVVVAYILTMLIAMSTHEYMHARVAYNFGDDTAKLMGRLTLNPLAHFDPIGLICLLLFGYGWAKPVPVNSLKFKKYRTGLICVSLAGVISNIVLAFVLCGILTLIIEFSGFLSNISSKLFIFLFYFTFAGAQINVSLCLFNLIPIPPLDGYNFLSTILPFNNRFVQFVKNNYLYIFLAFILISNFSSINLIGTASNFITQRFLDFWTNVI